MKVSICCITYNHEKFIAKALDSFLMQKTDFDFEIIVAEDCSPDNTRKILLDYKQQYGNKIKLVLQPTNAGMVLNLTNAIEACSGQYIAFCEGDDFWVDENKIANQVKFLDAHKEYVLCGSNIHRLTEGSGKEYANTAFNYAQYTKGKSCTFYDVLLSHKITTLTIMFRNGLINKFPESFFTVPLADWPLTILLGLNDQAGAKYFISDCKTGVYRQHEGGVYSQISIKNQSLKRAKTVAVINDFTASAYFEYLLPLADFLSGDDIKTKELIKPLFNNNFNTFIGAAAASSQKNEAIIFAAAKNYIEKITTGISQNKTVAQNEWCSLLLLLIQANMPAKKRIYLYNKLLDILQANTFEKRNFYLSMVYEFFIQTKTGSKEYLLALLKPRLFFFILKKKLLFMFSSRY